MKSKLCTDCVYYDGLNTCTAPQNQKIDLVTGEKVGLWGTGVHRNANLLESLIFTFCGKRARWFKPKAQKEGHNDFY